MVIWCCATVCLSFDGTEDISTKTKVLIINIQFIQLFIQVTQEHELFSQHVQHVPTVKIAPHMYHT